MSSPSNPPPKPIAHPHPLSQKQQQQQQENNQQTTPKDPPTMTAAAVGDPTADLDAIGAHCGAPYCHQLDFLPFTCLSCRRKYCGQHRTEDAHECPRKGAWAAARRREGDATQPVTTGARKPNILTHEGQCGHPACKTLVNTPLVPGIHCADCRRDYCLRHRLAEDHSCRDVVARQKSTAGAGAGRDEKGISSALGKLRAWGAARSTRDKPVTHANGTATTVKTTAPLARSGTAPSSISNETGKDKGKGSALHRIVSPFTSSKTTSSSSSPSAAAARQLTALNTLKRTAKGDTKIPPEKRIYVRLEAVADGREGSAGARVPRGDAFFGGEWSVGKVLDAAARQLEVRNVNNRGGGEEERLRVFWVEGGRLLGFGERVGAAGVRNGDLLVLLRGVGETDLLGGG